MSRFIMQLGSGLSSELCSNVINRIDRDEMLYRGLVATGLDSIRKDSLDLDLTDRSDWIDVVTALRTSLGRSLQLYADANPSIGSIARLGCHSFRLRKYPSSGGFDWHIDCYDAKVATRVISCVWYLNDVFQGGQTEFLYQGASIGCRVGTVLMFPASFEYVHRSSPCTTPKYVAVGFLEHF